MEPRPSYRKRLLKAASQDLRNFWSWHRVWVTLITLSVPFLVQVKNHGWNSLRSQNDTVQSVLLGLGLSVLGNCIIALWAGAKSLDAELVANLQAADHTINDLNEKPKRSIAEEHRFQTAKTVLVKHGHDGVVMLRHLKVHGRMVFGSYNPVLPSEITPPSRVGEVLALLANDNLVTRSLIPGAGGYQTTYEIPVGLLGVLDDLLYADDGSSTPQT